VAASETDNRPGQMDHYEINHRWQDLAIVLRGREISSIYQLREEKNANPLDSPDALAARLVDLATLEHAVALEYLYARYSLENPNDAPTQISQMVMLRELPNQWRHPDYSIQLAL
jgi:hypothetical protein